MEEVEISEGLRKKFEFVRLPENHYFASRDRVQDTSIDLTNWFTDPVSKLGKKGLYLYSGCEGTEKGYGVGKSSIAAIIQKLLISRGILSSLWIEYANIPMYITDDTMFDSNQTMMKRAKEVDFCVINEMNIKRQTQFPVDSLDYLIRSRVGDRKTTIITSNMSPKQLKKISVADSLAAISSEAFSPCLVSGKDLRRK